ncbi:hypothetical protein BUALT_Bualt02G0097800 [Buddleja alternifolia]|uniref:CRAL-TRIO domain-containing protein n=1 Tax=Buddleja alternifolia TaxID=168488 RepID=A0AAV6Y137_9LAMI|nr:hypothetical protein BUALT_Bualt02G0097800 [Buddleja alternifolia]
MERNITLKKEEEEEIFYSPERVIMEEEKDDRNNGAINNGYDECSVEEEKKLNHMRAILQNQDPACKELDHLMLRRFLRARDLDAEKACAMFIKYLKWRQTFVLKGFISASEVRNEIAQNKLFMQGKDKKGRPILVGFAARHFACKEDADELRRYVVFTLDKLCSRIPDGEEKFIVIGDLQGIGYCNKDIRGCIAALSILQDYYPERLEKLFLIHVPYIFMTAWKICFYPFIDKSNNKKIVFVKNKKLKATLMEDIDESELLEIYGGQLQMVPIQDA